MIHDEVVGDGIKLLGSHTRSDMLTHFGESTPDKLVRLVQEIDLLSCLQVDMIVST